MYSKRELVKSNIGEDDSVMVEIKNQLKYVKYQLK